MREPQADIEAVAQLRSALLDEGLLIETGVAGVYGHGEAFERIRGRLDARLEHEAAQRGALKLRFPPVLPRRELERSGYLASFPHLAGSVFSFSGEESLAADQAQRASRHEDWSEHQRMTEVALVPAACYPVYPAIAARGRLAPGGVFIDAGAAWVFRHEPSLDPARRLSFHQHELVRIGEPELAREWREEWARIGLQLMREFGLEAELAKANDPFFGRRGEMLAVNQRHQDLKLELQVPIAGAEPAACASFNLHLDHFALTWGLELADGGTAHTACVGFGHERIVLALLSTHGLRPAGWPPAIRRQLWD